MAAPGATRIGPHAFTVTDAQRTLAHAGELFDACAEGRDAAAIESLPAEALDAIHGLDPPARTDRGSRRPATGLRGGVTDSMRGRLTPMEFTNDDIDSLGDKLAAMDLTDGEQEALQTLVAMAGAGDDDEVAGFGFRRVPGADFGSLGLKLGPPRGRIIHTGDEIEVTKSGFVVVEGEVT